MTDGLVDARPSQELPLEELGIHPEWVERAVVFVAPDEEPAEGSEAIFRALLHAQKRRWRWGARLGLLPGVRQLSQVGYRVVARNRVTASRIERTLLSDPVDTPPDGP